MCKRIKNRRNWDLEQAKRLAKYWKWLAIGWRMLDYIFIVGSFAASVLVIYSCAETKDVSAIIFLSSISAIFTLMGFACKPTKHMRCYRKAFQILNAALLSIPG